MPGKDGTGPAGPGKGVGSGRQTGLRSGRMGGPASAGPEGYCECPRCGFTVKHDRAEPCSTKKCPQCGAALVRK